MDMPKPISPTGLYLELGTAKSPVLFDVRSEDLFAGGRLIVAARRISPGQWSAADLAKDRRVVVYGSQGTETTRP
jgi:rhodanese-related sulfurtransferase